MTLGVLQDINERVTHLRRRIQAHEVIGVVKDRALALPQLVPPLGQTDRDALHAPRQGLLILGLNDHVHVVALHRPMHDAKALLLRTLPHHLPKHLHTDSIPQRRQALPNAQRYVQRPTLIKARTLRMRNAIPIPLPCPSRSLPLATPPLAVLIQLESKALLHLLHGHCSVKILRPPAAHPGPHKTLAIS
jgi:hypothetical protein